MSLALFMRGKKSCEVNHEEQTLNEHHHHADSKSITFLVLVVSDTRTLQTDKAGVLIVKMLEEQGHRPLSVLLSTGASTGAMVVSSAGRMVVADDQVEIAALVKQYIADPKLSLVILTGGTGVSPRDVTPEAILPLIDKELPGFGETFRHLSVAEIGMAGMLSRSFAGVANNTLVVALPGSTAAVRLGIKQVLLPILPHCTAIMGVQL